MNYRIRIRELQIFDDEGTEYTHNQRLVLVTNKFPLYRATMDIKDFIRKNNIIVRIEYSCIKESGYLILRTSIGNRPIFIAKDTYTKMLSIFEKLISKNVNRILKNSSRMPWYYMLGVKI